MGTCIHQNTVGYWVHCYRPIQNKVNHLYLNNSILHERKSLMAIFVWNSEPITHHYIVQKSWNWKRKVWITNSIYKVMATIVLVILSYWYTNPFIIEYIQDTVASFLHFITYIYIRIHIDKELLSKGLYAEFSTNLYEVEEDQGSVTVEVTVGGLPVGSYTFTLYATNQSTAGESSTV